MNTKNKNTTPKISVIIVTYNSSHIIESCLKGLNFDKHNVIVVDNASSDNTTELVSLKFPKVKLIKLNQNIGYGRGNNIALRQIDTDYALILNPDASILHTDIDLVIDIMNKNKKAALAGILYQQTQGILNKDSEDKYVESPIIEGSITFLKMSVFRKIGFYDENIFLYYEDYEICHRVIKNGYKNIAIANLKHFHLEGQSSGNKTLRSTYKHFWHVRGWSKAYYEQVTKSKFKAKLFAVKSIIFYLLKILQNILRFNLEKTIGSIGACSGMFAFLIGHKAFKKDGTPRG